MRSRNVGHDESEQSKSARADEKVGIDVPVVAQIFSQDGIVLAEAKNTRVVDADPTGHAEIVAIRKAAKRLGDWRLDGLTLYSSLEPCLMCAAVIREARLSRVLFAIAADSQHSELYDVLRDSRLPGLVPEVIQIRSADTNPQDLREFFQKVRKKRQ